MAINIASEASCRKAYLNYHCYGNTMGIKPEEMGQITQAWEDRLESWQKTVSQDVNEYEFDDSDFEKYHDQGFEQAKETTGHNGKTGKAVARGVLDSTTALGSAVVSSGICGSAVNSVGSSLINKTAENAGKKTLEKASEKSIMEAGEEALGQSVTEAGKKALGEAAEEATEEAVQKAGEEAVKKAGEEAVKEGAKETVKESGKKVGSWLISAPLALAQGIAYLAKKPNKDEKEACDVLQNEMTGAQSALDQTQGDMQTASDEITSLSDQATEVNETANLTIQNHKTEYDGYMQSINYLKDKAASGQQLSDSEKALYKELTAEVQESATGIEDASTTVTDDVVEIYDDMATYQENYDMAAENMGQIEGLTDFAEGIDQTTQTMCYVESAAQGLNAAGGLKAAASAAQFAMSGGWTTAWGFAFSLMGAAGAAISGVGTAEQIKWAGEVGTEIDMRKTTQDLNTATNEIYTEEIDAYDGMMQGVEDLEVDVPDELDVPDGLLPNQPAEAAAGTANQTPATGGLLFSTTTSKSEEEEKTNKVKKNEKDEKA